MPTTIHTALKHQMPCCIAAHRRQLRDVGRSVSAFGYWGDVLNSPYHCFGTVANDPGLFKVANKQFIHTAVDVAEHNILVREGTYGRRLLLSTLDY